MNFRGFWNRFFSVAIVELRILLVGDIILTIEEIPVSGMTVSEVSNRIVNHNQRVSLSNMLLLYIA